MLMPCLQTQEFLLLKFYECNSCSAICWTAPLKSLTNSTSTYRQYQFMQNSNQFLCRRGLQEQHSSNAEYITSRSPLLPSRDIQITETTITDNSIQASHMNSAPPQGHPHGQPACGCCSILHENALTTTSQASIIAAHHRITR